MELFNNAPLTQKRKHLILLTLYTIVFLNSFGYFLIFPLLANMLQGGAHSIVPQGWAQHLGNYLFAVVLAAGSLSSMVFGPLIGRLSDFFGRKKILLICSFMTLASFILPIVALAQGSIVLFLISNAINGIASNNQPIAQAAISDISIVKTHKAYRFAIDAFVICLAMSTGPIAGSYLSDPQHVSWFSERTPFIFACALTLASILLLIWLLPETNRHKKQDNQRLSAYAKVFSDIGKTPAFIKRLLVITLLAQAAWAQFFQYIYIYLEQTFDYSAEKTGLFTSLLGVYLSISLVVIFPLLLRIARLRTLINVSLFTAFISFMGLSLQPSAQWYWAVPMSICMGLYFPCILTLLSEWNDTEQGWIMTVNTALIGLSWLITSFSSIWLSKFSAKLPLFGCAALVFIAWLVIVYEQKQYRSSSLPS